MWQLPIRAIFGTADFSEPGGDPADTDEVSPPTSEPGAREGDLSSPGIYLVGAPEKA